MRFADPHACPSCGGPIAGVPRCPRCGLDLTSPEMSQVWQLLLQADALLERATSRQPVATPAPPPPAAYVPPAPQAAFAPPAPQPPPAAQAPQAPQAPAGPPPSFIPPQPAYPTGYPSAPPSPQRAAVERRWSVGTVLLALGTFGLIVAGFIFVTREWGSLDLLGRTLVLLGVTVVIGALGAWVTRRTLRASAEAVWTVFLGLVTLDFFAARHEGLAGLDGIDVAWSLAIWGVILVGLGAGLVLLGRRPLGVDLVAPSLATGAGIALTGIGLAAAPDDWSAFWRAFAGLVVTGVLGLAVRPTGMRPVTIAARVVVAVFFLSAFVAALVEVGLHAAIDELVQDGHGAPALLMAAAAVVVGAVVPIVRGHAAALAVLALSVLAVAPASAAWETEGVWLSVAVVAVVPLLIGARGTGPWWLGVRLGATPAVLLLGGFVFLWATRALASMAEALDTVWPGSATGRVAAPGQGTDVAWTAVVALAMALVVVWFVASWPELGSAVRSGRRATTIAVAGVALVEAVVLLRLPVVAAAAVLLVGAAAATVLRDRGRLRAATAVAVGLVVAAGVLATSSQTVTWSSWLVGAAVLALLARVERASGWLSGSLAGAALGIGAWALGIALDDAGASHAVLGLVIVLVGLAALGAAGHLLRDHHATRVPVEVVASGVVLIALLIQGSTAALSARWTVAGVGLIALAFVIQGRRWYVWPGASALLVAYVMLIVDSGFSFVEAYTLPLGAVALALGLVLVRRRPDASTWLLLGPGLALALLPSVPQALADPSSLRALLLGLGSAAAIALGVRLGWQAPFVTGVTIVTALVLANLGPYANAVPVVLLVAAGSALCLGVGITWEDRVRDGRRFVGYVRSMR